MKIALTGTHSVGKSTLGKKVSEIIRYQFIDIASNIVKKSKSASIVKSNNLEFQLEIVSEYLKRFYKYRYGNFISARHFIDHLAYSRVNNLPKGCLSLIESILMDWKDRLTAIYVPIEFPMTKSISRVNDEKFREDVDKEIQNILKEFSISFIKVSGTVGERVAQVCSNL